MSRYDVTLTTETAASIRECLLIGLELLGEHIERKAAYDKMIAKGENPPPILEPEYESCRGDATADIRVFALALQTIERDDNGGLVG